MLPLLLWAVLQASPGQPVPMARPRLADCSGERNVQSCRSFNEMVEHQAKDLITALSTNTYVCFRSNADIFFVISLQQRAGSGYVTPLVQYKLFKDGILDDSRIAHGDWQKALDGSYTFRQSKTSEASASVTDDEVHFGYSFKNRKAQVIGYRAQIRRSTLRFSEDYEYPIETDGGHDTNHFTGYCEEFAPRK